MLGLAPEELTTEELEYYDARYPVLVTLRCRKADMTLKKVPARSSRPDVRLLTGRAGAIHSKIASVTACRQGARQIRTIAGVLVRTA